MTVRASGSSRSRDLAQHGEQAARAVEVLHQKAAGRLQVDQQRHARADAVEVVLGELDPEPPGDRQQVDHGVGRPADGGERDDRVLERAAGEEVARPAVVVRPSRPPAGRSRARPPAGGCRPRECRRCRGEWCPAPRPPPPSSRRCPSCCSARGCGSSRTPRPMNCCWERVPARTSSDSLQTSVPQPSGDAAERAGEHRAARQHDRRQVDRGRRHQQRRDRLVAAAEQHHAVDRVGAEHLLGRPSPPCCATASRSGARASRRARPPAGSCGMPPAS